ncbi:MAG: zf-HC2 domain-containing protein [Treponema sp.]|nr:zf-HC2 domain-containing protein [Treponema sp.]
MCPDPQLLSIYVDGELPSPWKEKMEAHIKGCPSCREKYENFKHLHELFKKDNVIKRTYVERVVDDPKTERTYTETELQEAKERVWNKINGKQRRPHIWRRRLSVPIPAAAAAAVIIAFVTGLWIHNGTSAHNGFASLDLSPSDKVDFILAAENEMPGIIPAADINGVLQFLSSDGADIIILRLPETKNFSRSGEPEIIRAADYRR